MTGHEHVPVVVLFDEFLEFDPLFLLHELGDRWLSINIYERVRDDGQLFVPRRQVEVVHQISVAIGIAKYAGSWIYRKLKNEAALVSLAPRMHANFHHALPYGAAVTIAREMSNGVEHQDSKATSIGYSIYTSCTAACRSRHCSMIPARYLCNPRFTSLTCT